MKNKKLVVVLAASVISAVSIVGAVGLHNGMANAASNVTSKKNYEIKPEISVEMPAGFVDVFPNAVLNRSYKIPTATAIDVYGDALTVRTALYAHYYSETRSLIQMENNAFTPGFYGVYTVCYLAIDEAGNSTFVSYTIVCE